jgi:hypothetical protein
MKRALVILVVGCVGFAAGSWVVFKKLTLRHAAELGEQQTAWQNERAELEAALAQAREQSRVAPLVAPVSPPTTVNVTNVFSGRDPREILATLQTLRPAPGADSSRVMRQAVYWLEELARSGSAALPAIREFLARYEDVEWDIASFVGRGSRDRIPADFVVPPTLRFGLFNALRQIGGAEAEAILVESLGRTTRGAEVAFLAQTLQAMAPNKYRDQSLGAARALLAAASPLNSTSPLDRNHRDYLFSVLSMYGDAGFAAEAQSQLVRADNQLDRSALKYLSQTLGPQSVTIAAQAYQNPALTNSEAKEPLARLALSFAGADAQANAFYTQAINDPFLTKSHRKNLIEDLNETGFVDPKNLTERDLPLIQNRLSLIEQLAPTPLDDANAAAFKEAYKDLVNMRDKILRQGAGAAKP